MLTETIVKTKCAKKEVVEKRAIFSTESNIKDKIWIKNI